MSDLKTNYMGLQLRNPIIVGSSNLTSNLEQVVACEKAGAGAVVLKSLFEEQILADIRDTVEEDDVLAHPEALALFSGMGKSYYMDEYLKLVKKVKKETSLPVIASLNCISAGTWIEYAKDFESVGADALELNFFILPADLGEESIKLEERYLEMCRRIKSRVGLPVSMKIGPYFTSMAAMVKRLSEEGMDALVLFNRFYRPDVDIEKMRLTTAKPFSTPPEISQSLQWIAILSGRVEADLTASTGVHDAEGVIKQLLVGAKAVQLCSVLYDKGIEYIQQIIRGLEDWMQKQGFASIDDFRGKLNYENIENPEFFERSQYIKALTGIS